MEFSVGDKVVHPYHGPGRITSIQSRDLLDGPKRYYAIEIPGPGLIVHFPEAQVFESGLRLAMSQASLPKLLQMLGSKPSPLPQDFKERQQQIWEKLQTGKVMQLARVVRDLTWHRERAHLTKRDTDYLKQGHDLLAAEMALVSSHEVVDASKLISATMTVAVASQTHLVAAGVAH